VLYRCPTCRTKYKITGKRAAEHRYVKCQVCGFLVETTSNVIEGEPRLPEAEARGERRRSYLPIGIALIAMFVLAWAVVTAIRWVGSVN
jgi:predicted Zn finger-like uncharacterized protein